jgi:hypothetical protein
MAIAMAGILHSTSAMAGWHDWSQMERNQAIVDETANWDDGDDGGQCKIWVQEIVYDASGSGLIPLNSNDACEWQYGAYVIGRSGYIEYASPGEIIQMDLGDNSPHTAIVIANSSYGVIFRESNWNLDEEVGTRYVSYSTFYNQVECFTIYYVL